MSTSKLIREETGEIVPWDSLTKQEKQDLWDNVWSKRIARVIAEYIHNHPEERKRVIDAMDWAREHPWKSGEDDAKTETE